MLLHKECLPTQLAEPLEQAVIAATFKDCSGIALTPGTKLAKCSDIPAAAAPQQLSIAGNVVSLTNGGSVTLPAAPGQVPQVLSVSGSTVSLSGGGGSVTLTDSDNQTLSISGQTLTIAGGNSVTLPAGATQDPYATPAQTVTGTDTNLIVNPADLYARENIPAQTGLGLVLSAIPAPAADQSPWGVNTLGETLHYAPGLGWQIVDRRYGQRTGLITNSQTLPNGGTITIASYTMPRAGIISVSTKASLIPTGNQDGLYVGGSYLNGAEVAVSADYLNTYGGSVSLNASETHLAVQAGDVLSLLIGTGLPTNGGTVIYSNLAYQYEV